MNFEGKNVLITGASSGIGKAIAEELVKKNCNIALLSRRVELLEAFANEHKITGKKIIAIKCDVTNYKEVRDCYGTIKNEFKQIDVAILNAGVSRRSDIKNFDSMEAEKIMKTNILGIIYWSEFLIKDFVERKNGILAGVSSLADSRGFPQSGFYSASKAAVTKILESLRIELKPFNIKVITIKPGFVKSSITAKNEFKMPLLMEADKAAKIIVKGIEKEKPVIQFPFPIAAGSKILGMLPVWLYDFLLSLPLPKK